MRVKLISVDAWAATQDELVWRQGPSAGSLPALIALYRQQADPFADTAAILDAVGFPTTFAAIIPDARLYLPQGIVGVGSDILFYDSMPAPHRARDFGIAPDFLLPNDYSVAVTYPNSILGCPATADFTTDPTEFLSRVTFIGQPWGANYFHWITDLLPRLGLIPSEMTRDAPLACVSPLLPFQRDSFEVLGFDPAEIVCLEPGTIAVKELIYPSRPHRTGFPSPWAIGWLRQKFTKAGRPGHRRLFVSRRDAASRHLINEAEILAALASFGVEVVVPGTLDFRQQVALFQEAALIIGPHGAGLTNSVFAPAGCRLIELVPDGPLVPCYRQLAQAASLPYAALQGSVASPHFTVAPGAICALVESALHY